MAQAWDRPEEHDHVVVVADDEPVHLEAVRQRLEAVPGRARVAALGRYPRFRVLPARDGDEAVALVTPAVSAIALDLVMPRRNGLDVIRELRPRRPDLAILAFTAGASPGEAVEAMLAGADHFHEYGRGGSFESALDLALDRRRLALIVEERQAAGSAARERMGAPARAGAGRIPGLGTPMDRSEVLPFTDAARAYLAACAELFQGDPRALAERLGISYFALRRLLKRYGVPFPGRTRRPSTSER